MRGWAGIDRATHTQVGGSKLIFKQMEDVKKVRFLKGAALTSVNTTLW
jgi:hypothetical protein